jgi:hypothetical protein
MKKLRLDDLQVDSFTTSPETRGRGTIAGLQDDTHSVYTACFTCGTECSDGCDPGTDPGAGTLGEYTCGETCQNGATNCGTCFEQASCDLQHGCGGTSFDNQMC